MKARFQVGDRVTDLRAMRSGVVVGLGDDCVSVRLDGRRAAEIVGNERLSGNSLEWSIADRLKGGTSLESLIAEYGVEVVERALRKRL